MLRKDLLPVLAVSLIKVGLCSDEFKKEVKNFNRERFSYFRKTLLFNFANFGVRLLLQAPTPDKVNINQVKYEIIDRDTEELLITNMVWVV